MQCQGFTKSGAPCRNRATTNGYCHAHGGVPSRQVARREAQRAYANMTPEQQQQSDAVGCGCVAAILALALLFGALTGDWHSVGRWLSR